MDLSLPRLRFDAACAAEPMRAFEETSLHPPPHLTPGSSPGASLPPPRAERDARTGAVRLWLEVGFGSGEHALAQLTAHPDVALIACEVFETGICSLLSRLVPDGQEADPPMPPNLRIWDDDARALIRLLPDASLEKLFLLFPDPWPKARHAKRRFVHPALLPEIARVLRPGGEWRIASDDPTYQQWVAEMFASQPWFASAAPADARPQGWPPTRYEAKAIAAGRRPRYWSFRRAAT